MNDPHVDISKSQTIAELNVVGKLDDFLHAFWENGGKEKYMESLELRRANGIPDSQWFKAQLMGLVDDAKIIYNAEETQDK